MIRKTLLLATVLLSYFIYPSFSQKDVINLAIEKYQAGDQNSALTLIDSLIDINPQDTLALYNKYQMCYYMGQTDEGFDAIQLIYPYTEACVNYGNLYFSSRDYYSAMLYYNKALDVDPNYVDAIFNRGLCQRYRYDIEEAIKDFELALKIKPSFMEVYNSLGNLYSGMYKYQQAIDVYDNAIQIDSTYKEAHYNKGLVQYKQRSYYEAKKSFDLAINIDPNFKEALYNRGIAKLKLDNLIMSRQITENIKLSETEGACDDLRKSYELGYTQAESTIRLECP